MPKQTDVGSSSAASGVASIDYLLSKQGYYVYNATITILGTMLSEIGTKNKNCSVEGQGLKVLKGRRKRRIRISKKTTPTEGTVKLLFNTFNNYNRDTHYYITMGFCLARHE